MPNVSYDREDTPHTKSNNLERKRGEEREEGREEGRREGRGEGGKEGGEGR